MSEQTILQAGPIEEAKEWKSMAPNKDEMDIAQVKALPIEQRADAAEAFLQAKRRAFADFFASQGVTNPFEAPR